MIDNTLGGLASIMGVTLVATMFLKGISWFSWIPPRIMALVIGEAATLIFWKSNMVLLQGADPATLTGWLLAALYGLFAVATAMKTHDFGSDPKTAVRPLTTI